MNSRLVRSSMNFLHTKCRNSDRHYIKSTVLRTKVPNDKVSWEQKWNEYSPPDYTDPHIVGQPWADPEIDKGAFKFNEIDGKVNRKSHFSQYKLDKEGRPLNPMGRTGLRGRGLLGRWGPNHAADPVVTRIHKGKMEFVAIQRGDTGEWALPGGMVDPGEVVSATLKREFTEEALNNVPQEKLEKIWAKGHELYIGYVDDHRNTDNAWMETVVMQFHDEDGLLADVNLQAGSDASNVRWIAVDSNSPLYASHEYFIKMLKSE